MDGVQGRHKGWQFWGEEDIFILPTELATRPKKSCSIVYDF